MERRNRIDLAITLMCLLTNLPLLDGCTSKPSPSVTHFPITNGFHTSLPTEQQRILIWGNPPLTNMAEEWLRSHHYSHLVVPYLNPLTSPQVSRTSSSRQTALMLASEMQADLILLLDQEDLTEETLIEPHCGARFNMSIEVRGLSVEHRETVLRGNAYYPHCVEHSDQVIQHLTCQALATAWGFRPSGQLEIPSHLACTAGQTAPTPTH